MLNPSTIVDAVVSTLQTIDGLVTAMNGDRTRIFAFHDQYGVDVPLARKVYEMRAPGILVAWHWTRPAPFNGADVFAHEIGVYMRLANQAQSAEPVGYDTLWWTVLNGAVNNGSQNIRQIQIIAPVLELMDTPSAQRHTDEDGHDFLIGTFVIREVGDN